MRTTVTLDSDVEQLLRDAMQRTRQSFKKTLNEAVRRGLEEAAPSEDEPPFEIHARPLGLRAGIDPRRLNQLNDELEVQAFLEVTRKLAERQAGQQS
jgi:hypothetical protein